jgi:hypothetical protein
VTTGINQECQGARRRASFCGKAAGMRALRALRLPLFGIVLFLAALQPTQAQNAVTPSAVHSPSAADAIDWKWIVTQGGLAGFALVILWSYRRDMERLLAESKDEKSELIKTLTAATVALTAAAEASRGQSAAFAELSRSVRLCEAVRQMVVQGTP